MLFVLRVLLLIGLWGLTRAALAEPPLHVLTSIKPLQLIALAVGGDAVRVDVLLAPQFSPHDYQLRPSDRAKLSGASAIFWVGPQLETFLQSPLQALGEKSLIVSLQDADADPHIWMDPMAAIQVARRMAAVLASLRPERRVDFESNADRLAAALTQQDAKHRAQLQQIPALRGYMVSHDAYGRFERRYGLAHRAALTDAADMPPSAKSLLKIERGLEGGGIACVWRQPHEGKLFQRVVAARNIRTVTIDAMAAQIPETADGILLFYERLWQGVIGCVAG